jgi:hypothetical protein
MFKRSAAVSFGISFAREVGVVAAAAAVIVLTFRAVDHFHSPGSGVKNPASGLKRFQLGNPGEYRLCQTFYHR